MNLDFLNQIEKAQDLQAQARFAIEREDFELTSSLLREAAAILSGVSLGLSQRSNSYIPAPTEYTDLGGQSAG